MSELAGLPDDPGDAVRRPLQGHGRRGRLGGGLAGRGRASSVGESYVNLIPTTQGGTHVNGFRTGLTEAIREFCEFRNLLPRGVKLAPEDVWARCSYILSVRMKEPQFTGQTKDRLSSREASAFVSGVTQDAFSIWLNKQRRRRRADRAGWPSTAPMTRLRAGEEGRAQEADHRPGAPRQARRLHQPGPRPDRALPGRRRLGRRLGQAGARPRVPGHHAAARQDPEHVGGRSERGARLAGGARHRRGPRRRSRLGRSATACATARSASSPTPTPTARTSRRSSAPSSSAISASWSRTAASTWPCRRSTASTSARTSTTRSTSAEKNGILDRIEAEGIKGQGQHPALQRPRRDEPAPAPRDDHGPRHPPPRAAHPAEDDEDGARPQ